MRSASDLNKKEIQYLESAVIGWAKDRISYLKGNCPPPGPPPNWIRGRFINSKEPVNV